MLDMQRAESNSYRLERIEYFSILGKSLTNKLMGSKIIRPYAKGDVISQSLDPTNHILLIHNGLVKIVALLMDGREFVIDTSAPGTVFGEIGSIIPNRASFEVQALTACEVWALDAKIVRDAIATDHELCVKLLHYVVGSVKQLEDRLVCLTSGVPSRLANALLRLSAVESRCGRGDKVINISQHELASMLPASREKVNRCLREWERSRIVDLAPGTITITNPRALHEYAIC